MNRINSGKSKFVPPGEQDLLEPDTETTRLSVSRGTSVRREPVGTKKVKKKKTFRVLKILLPHIGLTLFLIGYLVSGALIFQTLEKEHDMKMLEAKAKGILRLYRVMEKRFGEFCEMDDSADAPWRKKFYNSLSLLSSAHEKRPYVVDPYTDYHTTNYEQLIKPRWTYIEAVLYALSILTTTGYTHVMPMTAKGQVFAIIYGLIGIPLMVLTAVDIGRFLSECVLFLYSKTVLLFSVIFRRCGIRRPSVCMGEVNVKTRLISIASYSQSPGTEHKKHGKKKTDKRRKLPLWVNGSILLLFCTLGAGFYMGYVDGSPFLDAFFIAFNLVANLTMGEMPHIDNLFSVLYIVFFVTFGLAVLSMCAELAASELKWLFMKIHYFGRRIRRRSKKTPGVDDIEVKELLKIIEEIRLRHPHKERITTADILEYIYEIKTGAAVRRRRDTIAFMPESVDRFKFADDPDDPTTFQLPSPSTDSDSAILMM